MPFYTSLNKFDILILLVIKIIYYEMKIFRYFHLPTKNKHLKFILNMIWDVSIMYVYSTRAIFHSILNLPRFSKVWGPLV